MSYQQEKQEDSQEALVSDWWVDYVEWDDNENTNVSVKESLDLLVRHSESDQEIIDNLYKVRKEIKSADPVVAIEDKLSQPQYWEQLEAKIMKEVEETKPQKNEVKNLWDLLVQSIWPWPFRKSNSTFLSKAN